MSNAVDLSRFENLSDHILIEDGTLSLVAEFVAYLGPAGDDAETGLSDDDLAKCAMSAIMHDAWVDLMTQGMGQQWLPGWPQLGYQAWVIPDLVPLVSGIGGDDVSVTVCLEWETPAPATQSEADHVFLVLAAIVRAMKASEGRWNDHCEAQVRSEEAATAAEEATKNAARDAILTVEREQRTVMIRVKSPDAERAIAGYWGWDPRTNERIHDFGILGREVHERSSKEERIPRGDSIYGVTPAEWSDLDARRKAGRIKGISKFRAKNPSSWEPRVAVR